MSLRAAIYARVSSAAQRDAHTIDGQLQALGPFVEARGWTLVGTYVDDGRSAKTGKLGARLGFAELQAAIAAGQVDIVVTAAMDRLTRTEDLIELAEILGPLQRAGIPIVSPTSGEIDLRTFTGMMNAFFLSQAAAQENRMKAERIKAGKLRAIANNRKPAGPTPYGWTYDRASGVWSVDEVAAAIVLEIFRRVAAGESCVAIADDLARRRELGPRTGWSRAAVYRIVRKRTVLGEWTADKRRGAVLRIPAILTEEEWHDAQRALLRHRRRGLVRTKHVYLLEGLARCGHCGERMMIRSATNNRIGYRNPAAYVCRGRQRRSCAASIVRCEDLDARVWARLSEELEDPDIQVALAEGVDRRAGDLRDWRADILQHRGHLVRLETVERKVMERFRRGAITEASLDHELAAIGRERGFLRQQLQTAERAVQSVESNRARQEAARALLGTFRAAMPRASAEQRRELLRDLARDGSVVVMNRRARLDLRLGREVAASPAASVGGAGPVALADQPDSRRQHGAISEISLRLRLVA